jgi:phosphotransferase system enzyme I (PtsI)
MMASDPGIRDEASRLVTESGQSPERAVWVALGAVAQQFAAMGGRTAERASDLADVRGRLVALLEGRPAPGIPERGEPFVLVARDLAPADTAELNPESCRAIVTVEGGPTSHTAILARSLGIPAVVGARDALEIPEGTIVMVDGTTGTITSHPSAASIAAIDTTEAAGPRFSGRGQTSDGHVVELLANIGSPSGVGAAVDAGAEGIGLFRTEFCFLERTVAPTIDEQVAQYRAVFAAFAGKKVVVRTLDAGADKPLAFVTADHEDNPALGIRGIRTSWRRGDLLDDQLAAIARAAAAEAAHVQVMAPMVATVQEAREFARACSAHGIAAAGVMIETPAAALMAAGILAEVEFASLGTNDLAQYTMAADRLVGELAELNDPWQPAVLRLVAAACAGGVSAGKPVGVCGEAAADPLLAVVLVGLGVTSLSMTAKSIASVAAQLAATTRASCVDAARVAVAANSPAEARAAVSELLSGHLPSGPVRL